MAATRHGASRSSRPDLRWSPHRPHSSQRAAGRGATVASRPERRKNRASNWRRPHMTDRRYDLDWLRITAFGLLILYHCGMFYVTWDWHVKSSRASETIEPLMMLVNPWRLTLLMLISGAATRFMADKMSVGK